MVALVLREEKRPWYAPRISWKGTKHPKLRIEGGHMDRRLIGRGLPNRRPNRRRWSKKRR